MHGLLAKNAQAAQGLSLMVFPFTFIASAYMTVSTMPTRMQPVANNQPVTFMVNAVRCLTQGPRVEALLGHTAAYYVGFSLLWTAGIIAVLRPSPSRDSRAGDQPTRSSKQPACQLPLPTGGLKTSVRGMTAAAAGRELLLPRSQDAVAPTSIMISENAKVMCIPMMKGLLMRLGKKLCPDRNAAWLALSVCNVGPSKVVIGL